MTTVDVNAQLQVTDAATGLPRPLVEEDLHISDPAAGPGALEATQAQALAQLEAAVAALTGLATEATLDAISAALTHGTYDYAADTAPTTVDVPVGARVKRVSVIAGASAGATVRIAGGDVITVPAGGSFDEQIPGDAATGGDVVIGGTVQSFYVAWVT